MRIRFALLWQVAWSCCVAGQAAAQPPDPAATSYVSLAKRITGERALVIKYPWQVHAEPSVEVRLVTGQHEDRSGIRPLFFVGKHLEGDVRVKVCRTRGDAAGAGAIEPLTGGDTELEIFGRRNSLGRPSVCVTRRFDDKDPAPGAAAVFCLLEQWAVNKGLLYLDLPSEHFAEGGTIYVWFLRGEKVLWEEKLTGSNPVAPTWN